jgi:hypothetical protein
LIVRAIADGIEAGRQKVSAAELRAPRNGAAQSDEAPAAEEPSAPEEAPAPEVVETAAPEAVEPVAEASAEGTDG